MKTRFYAGIGSRQTPPEILQLMTNAATQLAEIGLVLRSGGAPGADQAFEAGIPKHLSHLKEIYIPWQGFAGSRSDLIGVDDKAMELAARFHPTWFRLQHSVQILMARNCYQVLGETLDDPVLFVLCYTKGGRGEGGTGQAIRIALAHDIPVFDMGSMDLREIQDGINNLIT